ncbi:MAG: cysteine hydrolase family protein [Isosphaerales bacterium]
MLEGPLVFVDIDTQRDFLEPAGALFVPGSAEILPNLARLTQFATNHHIPILATACAHVAGDPELTRFPSHCIAGTIGQTRVPATSCPHSVVLSVGERLVGDLPRHLTLQKQELDVFSRPDAADLVARYNRDRPTFVVYGVATDFCVLVNAAEFLKRQCRVAIVIDAVRAFDPSAEAGILTDFVRRGALLTVTDVVCGDPAS